MIVSSTYEQTHPLDEINYKTMIVPYSMALNQMEAWIHELHRQWIDQCHTDPIHHIQSRIKTKESICGKLQRQNRNSTIENARNYLSDVSGLRVVCHFIRDIDGLVNLIHQRNDKILLRERDYIRQPKDNGYRSYHMIFAVPVYVDDRREYYPVELQLRTLSMDFWSSMEHRICYKSHHPQSLVRDFLEAEFIEYARQLAQMEERMERYWI